MYHTIKGYQRVNVVASKLSRYTLIWWLEFGNAREKIGNLSITSWDQMKANMWKEFMPKYHENELFLKPHNVLKNSHKVQEYRVEFPPLHTCQNLVEEERQRVHRYLMCLYSRTLKTL